MKKRYMAIILVASILLSAVILTEFSYASVPSFQSLGSITDCTVDYNRDLIKIHGSIKHSVLIGNRNSKIAVYRFDPWTDFVSAIESAEPCAVTEMSITFDFELPCSTVLQKTSLYAVALIGQNGEVSLISAPTYPDARTKDTSDAGFKAILTSDHAAALPTLPGSAIVDVYLDKLNNGNNSGYIYNADGALFYFDKPTVNTFDRIIRSYTAAGTKVYLRFLISPYVTYLPFCSDAATWATNKCIVVNDEDALKAIYAYTAFLTSRYNGGDYGLVDGIILGRGADMPILNNYAFLVSEDYFTVYARSLAIIGLAASGTDKSLIVPISDTLTPDAKVNGEEFLYSVADYIETFTNLTFTVLCESRHNPYGITDDMFVSDFESDTTAEDTQVPDTLEPEYTKVIETEAVTEEVSGSETAEYPETDETSILGDITDPVPPETDNEIQETGTVLTDTSALTDETTEREQFQPNTSSSGFFCTDNIEVFQKMFEKLKKSHSSVNKGFAWCWYPGSDTEESALGVCYSYNYMKLASAGADFYAVGFENELVDRFTSAAHLLKYIDTSNNVKETAYARTVFGINTWKELINKWSDGCGVFSSLQESELQANVQDFSGEVVYLDYTSGKRAVDWYAGHYCEAITAQNAESEGSLKVTMDFPAAGFAPAEIGYMLKNPEPLLVGDALTFDLKCGEHDGSLYEVSVYINHADGTAISNVVVSGGVRINLSADVSEYDSQTLVNSIRITVKRVTGEGACDFDLYNVRINDYSDSSALLAQKLEDVRNYLRTDTRFENSSNKAGIMIGIVMLIGLGVFSLLLAYGNDRKKNNSDLNL